MKTFPMTPRVLVLAALLAACGGGGGGSPATTPATTPAPAALMSFGKTVIPLNPIAGDFAVGDFDGKNGPDIAVLRGVDGALEIFLNRGDGTFEPSSSPPPACPVSGAVSVFAGQFSADANIDLLIVCADLKEGFKRYLGSGDGSFANGPDTVTVPLPVGPFFNLLDTIWGAGGQLSGRVQLGEFGGGQALTYVEWIPPSQYNYILCFFRVNELIANFDSGGAYLPLCSNSFNVPGPPIFDPDTGEQLPNPVTVFDETPISSSYLLATPPLGSNENAAFTLPLAPDSNFPLAGDVRVVRYNPGCSLAAAPNYVACFSVENFLYPHPLAEGVNIQAAGDFNHDGVPEIVAAGDYSFAVFSVGQSQEVQPGVHLIADPLFVATDPALGQPTFLTVADFDGDGNLDVAVLTEDNFGVGRIQVFRGNGDGTFGPAQTFLTDYRCFKFIVADLNGDGRPDLVNLNYVNYTGIGPQSFLTIHLNTTPSP